MRSAVFFPIPGIAWKRAESPSAIARGARRRRARDDGERHLRADPAHAEQADEELPLGRVREAVELERVLADVEVRLERDLATGIGTAERARGRGHEVPDPADVEDEAVRRPPDRNSAEARDHPVASSSGGASAWQIATASASASCDEPGSASSPRMSFTIRCIWPFSARP